MSWRVVVLSAVTSKTGRSGRQVARNGATHRAGKVSRSLRTTTHAVGCRVQRAESSIRLHAVSLSVCLSISTAVVQPLETPEQVRQQVTASPTPAVL